MRQYAKVRHELADLDHQRAELDREHMEALREASHPRRSSAFCDLRAPDAWEDMSL